MEDDINSFENGRRPQYFWKLKTTSIVLKMEDDLNFIWNGRRPQIIESYKNERRYTDRNNATNKNN